MDTEAPHRAPDRSPVTPRTQRLALRTASGALGTAFFGIAALVWMDARPPQAGHAALYLVHAPGESQSAGSAARTTGGGAGGADLQIAAPPGMSGSLAAAERSGAESIDWHPDALVAAHAAGRDPVVKVGERDHMKRVAADAMQAGRDAAAAGRLVEARTKFEEAIELDPGLADARYGLAIVLIRLDDREGARAELEDLRPLDPSLANLLSNLLR